MEGNELKAYENRLRRRARRLGFSIRKSRIRSINADNMGGWMILAYPENFVISGNRFNHDLEYVEKFLNEAEEVIREEREKRRI